MRWEQIGDRLWYFWDYDNPRAGSYAAGPGSVRIGGRPDLDAFIKFIRQPKVSDALLECKRRLAQ